MPKYHWAPLSAACLLFSTQLFANMIPIPRYHIVTTDQFCQGKHPGNACTMPVDAFGGGEGRCIPEEKQLDAPPQPTSAALLALRYTQPSHRLKCQPNKTPAVSWQITPHIDEQLLQTCLDKAQTGGALTDACPNLSAPASDRFCQGKPPGSACRIEETKSGQTIRHNGTCRSQAVYYSAPVTMTRHQTITGFQRSELRCVPPNAVPYRYLPR